MSDSRSPRQPAPLERLLMQWEQPVVRWFAVAIAAGCVFAVVIADRTKGDDQLVTASSPGTPVDFHPSSSSSASAGPSAANVVVDVVGKVRRPGVVTLPTGSRVADAVRAAGGVRAGQPGVNLARQLVDGEQIVVGAPQPVVAAASGESASQPGAGGGKLNLNTATASQLEELPRIGPSKAAAIIDFRTQNGGFRSVEQLREIAGIGDVTFGELVNLVTV